MHPHQQRGNLIWNECSATSLPSPPPLLCSLPTVTLVPSPGLTRAWAAATVVPPFVVGTEEPCLASLQVRKGFVEAGGG